MTDTNTYIDISNKKCNKELVIINRKLFELINSKEGLWREIAELAMTIDFCLIEDHNERILASLEIIEKELGRSEKTDEIRTLVSDLKQKEPIQSS